MAPDPPPAEQQTLTMEGEVPWRMVGEVLRTYIVCETADGCVWLIDKCMKPRRFGEAGKPIFRRKGAGEQ